VFPTDFKKNNNSLRKTEDDTSNEKDLPPYRRVPPPSTPDKEDVPEKTLTLQERMSKFQQKVVSAPPPKVCIMIHFVDEMYTFFYKQSPSKLHPKL